MHIFGKAAQILLILYVLFTWKPAVCQSIPFSFPPSPVPDRIILSLTENIPQDYVVTWRTDTTVRLSYVEIALADHGPDFTKDSRSVMAQTELLLSTFEKDTMAANFHSAKLTGLDPDTLYAYRVGNDTHWSEWFQFRTASESAEKFSFIYFGDAQNNLKSMWSRVIREAYSNMPRADFILHAGDLINRANRDVEWGEWFYAGSFIHAMIPTVMTPGNHEYYDNERDENVLTQYWRPQFTLPENGPKGLEETCYYFDYQGMRFISLNSQEIWLSDSLMEVQKQWLIEQLEDNPSRWTCIYFHHPVFSAGEGRDNVKLRENFKPIFDQYQVDIVLQGHDHTYARGRNLPVGVKVADAGSGTMYVVSVSGPKMYDVTDIRWMDRKAENTQLFQTITIDKDTLRYEAYTATGTLYDAFDLVKQAEGPNKLVDRIPENMPERD